MPSTDVLPKTIRKQTPVRALTGSEDSNVKSILFLVHDDRELEHRLQAALSIARACAAHLQLLHVVPIEAYTVCDAFGGTFVSTTLVDALEQEADHHVAEDARVEVGDHRAQLVGADLREQIRFHAGVTSTG